MKMKSIKQTIFLLCAGMLLFSSCKESIPPHLKAIPADATFVVAFDNMKLAQKGGIDNFKDFYFYKKMQEESSSKDPAMRDFINQTLEDPKSLGIDIKKAYVFGYGESDDLRTGVVFKMNDQATFDKKVEQLRQTDTSSDFQVEDKGTYKRIGSPDAKSIFMWNDNLLMILAGNMADSGQDLLNLPDEQSIVSVPDFAAFRKDQNNDIACWVSNKYLLDFFQKQAKTQLPAFMKDIEGTYLHAYLNFENGEVKAIAKMSPQAKVDELMAKYPVIKANPNNDLLEDFPETSYLSARLSVNWMEYFKLLNETAGAMGDPSLNRMLEDPSTQKILNAIDGDAVFSIYGFAQGPLPMPLLGISFSVKSEDDFNQILSMFPSGSAQKTGDYYLISPGMGISIYMAYKDNLVFLTDDAESITGFVGKGPDKTLKNNELVKSSMKDPCFFHINLDIDSYPENIKTLLRKEGPKDLQNMLDILSIYKNMSYSVNDRNELLFSLRLKDDSQNSLKLLLKNMDDMSKLQSE